MRHRCGREHTQYQTAARLHAVVKQPRAGRRLMHVRRSQPGRSGARRHLRSARARKDADAAVGRDGRLPVAAARHVSERQHRGSERCMLICAQPNDGIGH